MKGSDNEFPSLLVKEGTAPASPASGDQRLFIDSADHLLKYKNSSGTVSTVSTGMTNPLTTTGDIIYSSSGSTAARLAIGAATTVLHGGTTPAYSAVLPADLDVSADNTTSDATTGHHGLLPKLGGGTTNFLRADGTWNAPAGGSFSPSFLGYNTVGASTENMTQFRALMKKITLSTGQTIFNVGAHIKSDTADHVIGFIVALLSDSSGSPLRVLAMNTHTTQSVLPESVTATPVARWLNVPLVYYNDSGGSQDVWISVMCTTATNQGIIYYDGSGGDRYYTSGGAWYADAGFYTVTTGTNKYSLRALVA